MINLHLGNIGQIIQLAIAPVFLLTGVGTNLTVLTNRLARIIDRSRVIEDVIDTLIKNNVIRLTDLPVVAQKKLMKRKGVRNKLGGALDLLGGDDLIL